MKVIRVLVVDDHNLVREGISKLLDNEPDIEIVGEAADGREAVEKTRELRPDVVLMDIAMPVMNGLEATGQIRVLFPDVQVLVLSMYDYDDYIVEILKAGALGYMLKKGEKKDLVAAIKTVYAGESYLYPTIATKVVSQLTHGSREKREAPLELLTPREKEILTHIAEGRSNHEIACTLNLSVRTVQTHRANIMKKLDFHNTAELVRYAIGAGLVETGSQTTYRA